MARKEPKTYTPTFEFQLVLKVLQGERSEVEPGRSHGVHHTTISRFPEAVTQINYPIALHLPIL